jgi:dGTPase
MPLDLGREHPDPAARPLPPLLVDRQRVVHAAAFRRLQQKTQVFVAPDSDHFRTRLTHTLEVAHQARLLATLLELNADLAEVTALAHDLGHPPFGHAGERALDACLADRGGFEHNRHTLRIVEELEHPYPAFHGLNLTRAVRECLAKHSTQYDRPGSHPLQDGQPPPPECYVVDIADRLTYALHDTLDALHADLVTPAELQRVALWRFAYHGPTTGSPDAWRGHLRPAADLMQQRVIDDLTGRGRDIDAPPTLSAELDTQLGELDTFLRERVYRSDLLVAADGQAQSILQRVFAAYVANPDALPARFRRRVDEQGLHRVVTDFVAGMTDRYCLHQHAHLADR